jgi:hypothetical protein
LPLDPEDPKTRKDRIIADAFLWPLPLRHIPTFEGTLRPRATRGPCLRDLHSGRPATRKQSS